MKRSNMLAWALVVATAAAGSSTAQVTPPPVTPPPSGQVPAPPTGQANPVAREAPPPFVPAIGPPIRRIATATAVSTEPLTSITSVLQLADGRVLLNDGTRRRLLLMDTSLNLVSVVLDSVAEISNTYGTRPGAVFSYRGDSTVFLDPASYAMLMFDPAMNLVRVRSVPRAQESYNFTSTFNGYPAFDQKGRLIYRTYAQPEPPKVAPPPGVPWFPQEPDSAFIVAIDLDTRKLDTVGTIRTPKFTMNVKQTVEGYFTMYSSINPLPSTDDWAVLPDGRIAFVRGRDYRVEWRNPDGTLTSSEKIPFDWQRMTDSLKRRMVDSVKIAQTRVVTNSWVAQMIRWANTWAKPYPASFKVPEGYVLQPGMPKDWILPEGVKFPPNYIFACPPGVEPNMPVNVAVALGAPAPLPGAAPVAASGGAPAAAGPTCFPAPPAMSGGVAPPPPVLRDIFVVQPDELPDYKPPFTQGGAVRADGDGNLWVRVTWPKPIPGGVIYDIIDPTGKLVDRLQIPTGYTLVGFGKGKVVYLSVRDAKGLHLARVRLK